MLKILNEGRIRRFLNRRPSGVFPIRYHRRSGHTLAFEEISLYPDKPHQFTAFILHGLLGSGRNWRSFARSLANELSPTDWRLVLVDLRNHGKSAQLDGLLPPHNMGNAAKDLANLVKSENWDWPDVVIGHSMGGKVALQYAQSCASEVYGSNVGLPKQLWVLDSVPGKVSSDDSNGEVEKVLQILQDLPSTIRSRRWLVDHLLKLGFSKSLSEWLGSNLKKSGEQETWEFNLDGALQMFNSYREMDYGHLLEETPEGMAIDIVRAEKSDRWTPDVMQQLESVSLKRVGENGRKVSIHVLPNAGHWVHVDNPKGLLEMMAPRIASIV